MDVCEIYPTIKSSGINAGKPVLCVRLFGTDFRDNNDPRRYAWDKKPENMALNRHRMEVKEVVAEISKISSRFDSWVITGGEPLLQQDMVLELLKEYKEVFKGRIPVVEIQTNGFIEPDKELDKFVDKYCVEVKLGNTMDGTPKSTFSSRIQEQVLAGFAKNSRAYFMFAVDCEEDIKEVVELQKMLKLDADRIYLKPRVIDARGIMRGMSVIWGACLTYGYTLSNRFYMHAHGRVKRGI